MMAPAPTRYLRRVIRIRAEDSPNVVARRDDVLEGVLTWSEYQHRRATWDPIRACVGLDGEFYEGAEILLFPPQWLNRAEAYHDELVVRGYKRKATAIGIDPGEGAAETAMVAVDRYGVLEVVAQRTPDTSVIRRNALAFMVRHSVEANRVCFDRGGGGKQIADELRRMGHAVRTVGFGESVQLDVKRGHHTVPSRKDVKEEAYAYKNRRAEMYGRLSELMDPGRADGLKFALPSTETELRRQLAPLPKLYDEEARLYLPPKNKRDDKDTRKTLTEVLGCSPDRADALVLAVHAMMTKDLRPRIEVM